MTKLKTGDRVVPGLNTTERIVEAIKKAEIIEDCINGRLSIAIAYCNLEDEISSVIGQERWISVEDRLPEENQDTMFCSVNIRNLIGVPILPSVTTGYYQSGNFYSWVSRDKMPVTHWQPLPAPPLSDLTPPKTDTTNGK